MSGHSKWATIKHKKGAADKARAKVFNKIARLLEVAAREGGIGFASGPTWVLLGLDRENQESNPNPAMPRRRPWQPRPGVGVFPPIGRGVGRCPTIHP